MNPSAGKWSRAGSAGLFVLDSDELEISLTTASDSILKPDPDRIAFLVQGGGGVSCYISTTDGASGTNGLFLGSGGNPVLITDDQLPGMAARGWYGWCSAAGGTLRIFYVRIIEG